MLNYLAKQLMFRCKYVILPYRGSEMKSGEVLRLLGISRPTLAKHLREGRIRAVRLQNGHWDYNEEDVYKIFNKGIPRKTFIYARVSTAKQKADLENQTELLKRFCFERGYSINQVFADIASGIRL